jgi:type II secretory ATPase GspE/PulE/Tfp pilus assembly ATPase PilB-like protein
VSSSPRPNPDGGPLQAAAHGGDPDGARAALDRFGYDEDDLQAIRNVLDGPDGLVLVVGPPACGRRAALDAMRQHVEASRRPVVTLGPRAGRDFERALRAAGAVVLHAIAAPGIAQRAVQAAQAGRLVLSTMTLGRACGVLAEFQRLQVPLARLLDALCLVIGQRRVRRLCSHCAIPDGREEVRRALAAALNTWMAGRTARTRQACPQGCAHCAHTGYDGTLLAYELVDVDQRARGLIASVADPVELECLLLPDGRSVWDRGLKHVALGETSLDALRAAIRQPH